MRRYGRRGAYGRAARFVKTVVRTSGAKRTLRGAGQITATNAVETRTNFITTDDTPSSLTVADAGSKLTFLKLDLDCVGTPAAGEKWEFMVYINRSALGTPSTTPIADFWATTEPVTQASMLIRKSCLRYWYTVIPGTATSAFHRSIYLKFRRGLSLYDGDAIVLAIKNPSAVSRNWAYQFVATTRE